MDQASAPGVFGTAILGQPLPLTLGDAVCLAVLLLSLVANALQLYRRRVWAKALRDALAGTVNSVGWLLARCAKTTEELHQRGQAADRYVAESAALRELRAYSLETEFMLRMLREQLASVARISRARDQRWQTGRYTPEEIEEIGERSRSRAESDR